MEMKRSLLKDSYPIHSHEGAAIAARNKENQTVEGIARDNLDLVTGKSI